VKGTFFLKKKVSNINFEKKFFFRILIFTEHNSGVSMYWTNPASSSRGESIQTKRESALHDLQKNLERCLQEMGVTFQGQLMRALGRVCGNGVQVGYEITKVAE